MVSLLFEAGADVNYQDSRGWTPVMIAAAQGYEDLVEFLLEHNADLNLKDKYGKKAVDKAKNQSVFYMLSSAGVDKRMKQSKDQYSGFSPERFVKDEFAQSYQTAPNRDLMQSSIKKVEVFYLLKILYILFI